MEVICLDTDILIEFYRNKNKANTILYKLTKKYKFAVPTIVMYEILRGDKKKDEFWNTFFSKITILPFDKKCSKIAAEIYKELKENKKLVGTDDILIAATAIGHQLKLATLNIKDFNRIKELTII